MNQPFAPLLKTCVWGLAFAWGGGAWAQAGGDARAGESKAAMCMGCHNIAGYQSSFPEVHKVPKLGGQSPAYLVAALTAYQKGERKHPTMRGMAASLTPQDMADLAAFYAAQSKPGAATGTLPAAPAAVQTLLEKGACTACHGPTFSQPVDATYPKLAGQHADYLFVALKAYTVSNQALVGRSHPIMGAVASQFSLAEMRQLAHYLGRLDGELQTVSPPPFR